jgi:hypothetical protein
LQPVPFCTCVGQVTSSRSGVARGGIGLSECGYIGGWYISIGGAGRPITYPPVPPSTPPWGSARSAPMRQIGGSQDFDSSFTAWPESGQFTSNQNPLHLIKAHLVAAAVVELRGARRRMVRHCRGLFQRAVKSAEEKCKPLKYL